MHLSFHVPQPTWLHCEFSDSGISRRVCGKLAVCGVQVPKHWQWWVQGRPPWGEPVAALSQTQQFQLFQPTLPSQGTESHGEAPLGKQSCAAVRSEGNSCHTQVREGRRGGCAPEAEQRFPMAKIMVRQPVLWQTVETMQEQAPGCGLWRGAHEGTDYLSDL